MPINMEVIKSGGLPEILEAIKCGELNELACLCSPEVRQAADQIATRFGLRQQAIIYKALCGCALIQPLPPPAPGQPTTPTIFRPTPNQPLPPAPTPPPAPPPAPPAVACNPALPAPGTMRSTNG